MNGDKKSADNAQIWPVKDRIGLGAAEESDDLLIDESL